MWWFRKREREVAPQSEGAPQGVFEVPVLVVCYFPTVAGCIDVRATGDVTGLLSATRKRTQQMTKQIRQG